MWRERERIVTNKHTSSYHWYDTWTEYVHNLPFHSSISTFGNIFRLRFSSHTLSCPISHSHEFKLESNEIFIWMNGICSLACNVIYIQHSNETIEYSLLKNVVPPAPSTVQWWRLFRFLNWMIRLVHQYRQTKKKKNSSLIKSKGF